MSHTYCEAFNLVADLAAKHDAAPLNKFPACWEHQVDAHWWIAVNGHREDKQDSTGGTVPPFSCAVTFNGFPAGVFNPYGGVICAGEVANEDTFCAALQAVLS